MEGNRLSGTLPSEIGLATSLGELFLMAMDTLEYKE